MERDLRDTPLYQEVEAFFRAALEPGFGRVTGMGEPEPSPDGRSIAFEGRILDALEGHGRTRICLAATEDDGFRVITAGPNDDTGPRWSPDGRTLSFISDRATKGRGQLYALRTDDLGEARALASVPGVVEHHRWSPDGSKILVVVAGEHAEQSDARGSGTLGPEAELPPWVPEVESSDDADEWRSLWILDVASDEVRRVSREGLNVWEATWLGDASAAAIVSEAPGEGAWYTSPLAVIDFATGEDRIVYRSDVQLEFAEGSPDGATIAVLEALCSDRYVIAGDLLLVDPVSGEVRRIDVTGDASSARWFGDRLLVASLDRLDAVVSHVDPGSGSARERWRTSEGAGASHQPFAAPFADGSAFACVVSSAQRPPTLVVVSEGSDEREVAHTRHDGHEAVAATLAESRAVTWTAPDGLEIDGILLLPHGDGPFPLLLDVHGGPIGAVTDQWTSVGDALLLSRGYAIMTPNPRGSTGRGQAFAAAVVGDMGGADALDDLAGVDALVEAGIADPDRIGVMGGSYGGFMAAWLPAVDGRFKVALSFSPVTDWYSEHFNSSLIDWVGSFLADVPEHLGGEHHRRSPVLAGQRLRTPTLLTAGLRDRATPPGQAVEMYRALRTRGVPAEVALYPREGHGVRDFPAILDLVTRSITWVERFLPAR
ncbi:MAG: S9 family peptidase [Actinomycetota bacterium]